jgi:Zn-dependent alcohol dehydrogenase
MARHYFYEFTFKVPRRSRVLLISMTLYCLSESLKENYGSIQPSVDIPWLVDQFMDGNLKLEEMVSARRPLEEAALALAELEEGKALRQILIP